MRLYCGIYYSDTAALPDDCGSGSKFGDTRRARKKGDDAGQVR